jgi:hypothetical protein
MNAVSMSHSHNLDLQIIYKEFYIFCGKL